MKEWKKYLSPSNGLEGPNDHVNGVSKSPITPAKLGEILFPKSVYGEGGIDSIRSLQGHSRNFGRRRR